MKCTLTQHFEIKCNLYNDQINGCWVTGQNSWFAGHTVINTINNCCNKGSNNIKKEIDSFTGAFLPFLEVKHCNDKLSFNKSHSQTQSLSCSSKHEDKEGFCSS